MEFRYCNFSAFFRKNNLNAIIQRDVTLAVYQKYNVFTWIFHAPSSTIQPKIVQTDHPVLPNA